MTRHKKQAVPDIQFESLADMFDSSCKKLSEVFTRAESAYTEIQTMLRELIMIDAMLHLGITIEEAQKRLEFREVVSVPDNKKSFELWDRKRNKKLYPYKPLDLTAAAEKRRVQP